jgi:hypothetical protein
MTVRPGSGLEDGAQPSYASVRHLVRYETLNIPDPEIHAAPIQEALTGEMETFAEANVDDQGVVFPVQHFVVVATR